MTSESNGGDETFVIVTHYNGFSDVILAKGLQLALRGFMMNAKLLMDLFPDQKIEFLGNDIDSGFPCLSLRIGGSVVASLQHPAFIDGKNVVEGRLVEAKLHPLPGLDSLNNFASIGAWLTWLYSDRDPKEAERRKKAAMMSWPALRLSRDYNEVISRSAAESLQESEEPVPSGDKKELRAAIDAIRLMVGMTATVRG